MIYLHWRTIRDNIIFEKKIMYTYIIRYSVVSGNWYILDIISDIIIIPSGVVC